METYKFDIPRHNKSIIKVIGVGGGGSNAVNHMFNQGIKDVEFYVCNTDSQAMKSSVVPNRLQLGMNLTQGLGAGANPEVGKNAAIETREEIRDILSDDTRMVFITAGMGGGTGTGAAPVIAKIARDMDILTVGIVTAPFSFEGKKKMSQAQQGIDELRANCDTVLVILNDKLREIYGNLTINNAFAQADNILTTAAKGIAEIITVAGYVNVDFQDVRTVMKNAGAAVMGSAETAGENRARRAAEEALASPLLDSKDIMGAQNILLSIISGDKAELQMDELTEITEYIQEQAGDHAEVIFGHGVDPELEDKIRVTVIATGFESVKGEKQRGDLLITDEPKVFDLEKPSQYGLFEMDNSVNNTDSDGIKLTTLSSEEDNLKSEGFEEEREQRISWGESYNDDHFEVADNHFDINDDDDLLFKREDDYEFVNDDETTDQTIDDSGLMGYMDTKERLERQAKERTEKIKGGRVESIDPRNFKEKLDVPAYLRKSVRLDNVPHSSEPNISKYKLNEENQILGNNRFLYDNVD
ncbi:MAG: cell division protein FtsZ [Cyclobacteriaceae bacterium]|nr:cell division protein FtsZ [Cyclobacteriaceae bacterium]